MASGYTINEKEKALKDLEELRKSTQGKLPEKSDSSTGFWDGLESLLDKTQSMYKETQNKKYSNVDLSKYNGGFSPSLLLKQKEAQKKKAEEALGKFGDFTYDRQTELDNALKEYSNRKGFEYDVNADALYKQYEDKYMNQGKRAMQDAIGQAQAATGGYGNSYAATVGNQAYQSHVQGLTDIIPQLYQMAQDKYNQDGEDLYKKYALLADDRATAYNEHLDEYQKALADRDYYASQFGNEYNREYGEYSDQKAYDYNRYWDETKFGYQKDLDALSAMGDMLGDLNSGSSSNSSGTTGGTTGNKEQAEDRSEILDKIAKTLSGDVFQYDGEAAKEYINGLLYSGTITTEEAKYLWNMSGVGALTGTKYDTPSAQGVAVQRFMKNAGGANPYDEYRRGTADSRAVEKEIKRQYEQGLISAEEAEHLMNYYGIAG